MVAPIVAWAVGGVVAGVGAYIGNATSNAISDITTPTPSSRENTGNLTNIALFMSGGYKIKLTLNVANNLSEIDEFFNNFGVRVDRYDVPKLSLPHRPDFTYIKTKDARVKSGSANADEQLTAMLNAGYKFHRVK